MKFCNLLFSIIILLTLISCSQKDEKVSIIKEKDLEMQMIEAYNEGLKEYKKGDIFFAAKKFNEVELLYPQSIWAPRSALMAAYIFYSDFYFNDAIFELDYNLIVDEKRDLGEIIKSKKYFNILIKNYPNTDFAEDAQYKLQLIEEILASKELYLANYYLQREKWIPAMNRYKKIVNEYDTTIFIEEALFRLVELNFKLGLVEEAKKYTVLLGYNYQSSEWYNRSYEILNKNYKKRTINDNQSKNRESIIKKFKKLFQ